MTKEQNVGAAKLSAFAPAKVTNEGFIPVQKMMVTDGLFL
jgi:hypothetical protein